MLGAFVSQPPERGLNAHLHAQLLAAAETAAAQHAQACFAEPPSSARSETLAAAETAAAARPAAEATAASKCSSVHLRLYYRGLEAKRQKQQRKELLLLQQRSRCGTLPASSSSSSTGLLVSQQLYEDALTRRQKQLQQQQRQQQQQQELRSKSKLSAASLRVFQQRLLKEIRQAYAELQPEAPEASTLPAALLPQCMQLLGIFQQQQQQQQQEDSGIKAKKKLAAAETAERELRLSEWLCRVLDPEGLEVVSSGRLFQFLAGVLTECGSSSSKSCCDGQCGSSCSSSSSRRAQFAAADRELKRLGLASLLEGDKCMHAATAETPQLQQETRQVYTELQQLTREFLPLLLSRERGCFFRHKPRCKFQGVCGLCQGRQQRARRERRQLLLQQQQEQEILSSQWRTRRPVPFHAGGPFGPPWGPHSAARRKQQTEGCGLPRHMMLYELAQQQQQQRQQQLQQRRQQQQHEALRECTFRPNLSLTSNAGRQGHTLHPKP
ncbi:hypothetical protein Esti_006149 [Eimeria stiedai]